MKPDGSDLLIRGQNEILKLEKILPAIICFEKYIELNPKNPVGWFWYAYSLGENFCIDLSRNAYQECLKYDQGNENGQVYFRLANLEMNIGNFRNAGK
ncbi:MAG: hypothetical protein G3M70_15590 [Candidatus Nitronauta litoralis]|uniref:Tetratricopeptide repeat protein n=1 Tax=Candidatus Nitronauta litoralis TaxID=2705533 RepID=A0A7T0BYC9_9BACT|nr:MAG: hypothetical protein G3M70_15590 [Candidatus Nitronauta litoralis]